MRSATCFTGLAGSFGRQVRLTGLAGRIGRQVRPGCYAGPLCWAAMLGHYAGPLCCAAMLYGEIKIIARKMGVMETITIVIEMNSITFKRKHFSLQHSVHYSDHDISSLFIEK